MDSCVLLQFIFKLWGEGKFWNADVQIQVRNVPELGRERLETYVIPTTVIKTTFGQLHVRKNNIFKFKVELKDKIK